MNDHELMLEAVELARRGWGRVSPNPMVGALVVKNGMVIGRGWHHKAGEAHAEINAIADCKQPCNDATLYVTLEPCSTWGRTPPCTDAIIRAGFARVLIGSTDPNPAHAGRGIGILRAQGIEVISGVAAKECDELNEAFFKWIVTGRPFVLLKMAMTLDGKIATRDGNSQWVTGESARERVQSLRQWADAVMVGAGTARTDHPSLNVRSVPGWEPQPRRIVVSNSMSANEAGTLLAPGVPPEVLSASSPEEWDMEMARLGRERVCAILVEGGGELAGNMIQSGVVDRVEFHIAAKILGGRNSRPVVGGTDPVSLSEAFQMEDARSFMLGSDFAITGKLRKPSNR